MKKFKLVTFFLICVALVFISCGDSEKKSATTEETAEVKKDVGGDDKGVIVAKDILNTFDRVVGEVAKLVKDKPNATELKPKIEALYQKYAEEMKILNARYLDLKGEDIVLFGSANGYLGENRGKHVFKKDTTLDVFLYHYNLTDGGKEIYDFLKNGLINLLEIAVKR